MAELTGRFACKPLQPQCLTSLIGDISFTPTRFGEGIEGNSTSSSLVLLIHGTQIPLQLPVRHDAFGQGYFRFVKWYGFAALHHYFEIAGWLWMRLRWATCPFVSAIPLF